MKKIRTTLFNVPVNELTEAQASSELSELAEIISHHNQLYYKQDAPEISDAEYDELRRRNDAIELRFPRLILPDSPSHRIGAEPSSAFKKIRHAVPMMSLDNAFTIEDVRDFIGTVRNFIVEIKPPTEPIDLIIEP